MGQESTILLIGGPDAGKTNYIGRLWLGIREAHERLQADGNPKDLDYLNRIVEYILQGRFAPHTPHGVRNRVTIPIKYLQKKEVLHTDIVIPDVSGEEWMQIFRKREWSDEWEKNIVTVRGCLIFVRVESDINVPAVDWLSWSKYFQNVPQEEDAPTQVVLVDWLQCLRSVFLENTNSRNRPRIGIVVSAYDLLPEDQKGLGPDIYLRRTFPLLWQYIHAAKDQVDIEVFGTSIVSGDFDIDQTFKQNYLNSNPMDSGYVVYQSGSQAIEVKDISLPVVWAMGLTNIT